MKRLILLAALVSGCTSIAPMTAMQLSRVSPLTADPADFAVQMDLPDGIDVRPGTAKLRISVERNGSDQMIAETFTLQRDGSVFAINPDDHTAFRALQATAGQWKAESDADTTGSFGVTLGACKRGTGPAEDATVNIAIRMEQDGAFLPLVRNGPISAVADSDEIREMNACP